MKKLLFASALLFTLTACEEDDPSPVSPDYLVFGHYYGMCLGEECVEIFKIENGKLYEDTKDIYPSNKPYAGEFVEKSQEQYQKVKDLPAQFPTGLLTETDPVIGSPDATDAGGIYLEVMVNGTKRYFFIDKLRTNVPGYLNTYLDKVEANISALK